MNFYLNGIVRIIKSNYMGLQAVEAMNKRGPSPCFGRADPSAQGDIHYLMTSCKPSVEPVGHVESGPGVVDRHVPCLKDSGIDVHQKFDNHVLESQS